MLISIISYLFLHIYVYVHVCGFRYYQICFYIYMCMYKYVDFNIIKFVSTYICVCTCMWISILSNLLLHIQNVHVYIHACDVDIIKFAFTDICDVHVCGFRYYEIPFYIYKHMHMYLDFDIIKCRYFRYMCMYMHVDFDIIKFVSTDICVCTCIWTSI